MNYRRCCMKRFFIIGAVFLFLQSAMVDAAPLVGYVEATSANGWAGSYAVLSPDGNLTTGVTSTILPVNFDTLPLSTVILNISGDATLGSLGSISWGAQPVYALPGSPSPVAAVLASVHGTLAGTMLMPSTFVFNGTLTSTFALTDTGQALQSLRLDFADGVAPPVSNALLVGNTYINNGVPVAFGTPINMPAPVSVPEAPTLWLLTVGLAGVILWKMCQLWRLT